MSSTAPGIGSFPISTYALGMIALELGIGTCAGEAIAKATGSTQVGLITVPGVGRRYAPRLMRSLRAAGLRVHRFDVPDVDATKNLADEVEQYLRRWDNLEVYLYSRLGKIPHRDLSFRIQVPSRSSRKLLRRSKKR